ncbi:MAG: cation:proton antiporter [Candidatus Thermoplasmatota archaeon]|nr:cation:proton antiporter [Candidatus Thermoplasmatota archaeon]MBS3789376.1 cation:proton antiporter [Candidatus Thermoplasmatota archaeon]
MVEENILVNPLWWTVIILLGTSFALFYRVIMGPTLPDRIIGINTITTKIVVGIAVISIVTEQYFLIDLAIVLLMVNTVGGLILAKHFERGGEV